MSLPDFPTPPLSSGAPPPSSHPVGSLVGMWKRLGPWRGVYGSATGCLVLSALAAIAEVIAPVLLGQLIDALLPGAEGLPWGLFALYACVLVASVVFDRWGDLVEVAVAGQVMAQVHVRLLSDRLLENPESAPGRAAERAARLTQAASASGELFRSGVAGPTRIALAVIATVVMATFLSPALGLASLVWSVLLLATTVLIAPQTGRLADAEQRARSDATSHASDAMEVIDQLRRQRAEAAEIERGLGFASRMRARLMARTRYAEARLMVIGVFQAGFVITVLWIGLAQWQSGAGTPGDVAAAVGLALALMDNLQWAGQQVSLAQSAKGALAGILREWPGGKRRLWLGKEGVEERHLLEIPGEMGLVLKNISMSPLKRLEMEVEPGEHTGVVGPQDMRLALFSAISGQSAVQEGEMHWGKERWCPRQEALHRDEVVRIPAQPTLFDRSVRENMWLDGKAHELPSALSPLLAFVETLPQGWETPSGKHGGKLAIEHRLRLALARSLIDPPTWLVLDELPTGEAGERLLSDLRLAIPDGTTLIVGLKKPVPTHLLVSVVVLAHGRVVEDGNPADLLAHGKHYARWASRARAAQDQAD